MFVFNPKRENWRNLSTGRRIGIMLMTVVQISLLVAALLDIRKRPPEQINGKKRMWVGLAFINFFGPIAYFTIGRKR